MYWRRLGWTPRAATGRFRTDMALAVAIYLDIRCRFGPVGSTGKTRGLKEEQDYLRNGDLS